MCKACVRLSDKKSGVPDVAISLFADRDSVVQEHATVDLRRGASCGLMSMGAIILVPLAILTSLATTTTMTQAGFRAHPFGDHPMLRRGHHGIGSDHPRETPGALPLLLALRWHRKVAMRIAACRSHFPASAAPMTWPFHGSLGAIGGLVGYDPLTQRADVDRYSQYSRQLRASVSV